MAHPALEAAAIEHAAFLGELAERREPLHRQVLLVHHHPARTGGAPGPTDLPTLRATGPRRGRWARRQRASDGAQAGAGRRARSGSVSAVLVRRVGDGVRMLAAADLPVRPLDGAGAGTVLAQACAPDTGADGLARGASEGELTPHALAVSARSVQVAADHVATLAVTGYPDEVALGWLEPLLTYPGRLDVAVHLEPVPAPTAADRLRRQRARLEASRRMASSRGALGDPQVEAAAEDAADLARSLARGSTHLFRVGIYLTVHASDPEALAEAVAQVRALAASLLLTTEPATWRAVHGWVTTLPLGIDALRLRRTLDTAALAAAFPFTSPDLPAADPTRPGAATGVLYGTNATSTGLVIWDRWTQSNYNSVVLARSGAGKSYLTKLEILRSMYSGVQVQVIDPETEYTRLADTVGGTVLHLGRPGVHLNPLDLPAHTDPATGGPARRALFVHTFSEVALGGLDPVQRAALDAAVATAYQRAGISEDPRTWARPAPLLSDVAAALTTTADAATRTAALRLAARLAPYVTGSHAGLFNAHQHPPRRTPDGRQPA